jgi:hypothetical protein
MRRPSNPVPPAKTTLTPHIQADICDGHLL